MPEGRDHGSSADAVNAPDTTGAPGSPAPMTCATCGAARPTRLWHG